MLMKTKIKTPHKSEGCIVGAHPNSPALSPVISCPLPCSVVVFTTLPVILIVSQSHSRCFVVPPPLLSSSSSSSPRPPVIVVVPPSSSLSPHCRRCPPVIIVVPPSSSLSPRHRRCPPVPLVVVVVLPLFVVVVPSSRLPSLSSLSLCSRDRGVLLPPSHPMSKGS